MDRARKKPPTGLAVDVAADPEVARIAGDTAWVRERLLAALCEIDRPVECVGVQVVGETRMRELSERHGRGAAATDVLAFELSEPGAPLEAEIAICAEVARRRASDLGHPVERELLLYALHGVLHCAGFDDHDDASYRAMHAEEDRILCAIGVGPTFAAPGGRGDAGR